MEIGGVLMGEQITPGHFRIVDFSVDTKSGDNSRFIRRPEHHREALDAFFAKTEADYSRFNYLGEWHSHPSYEARPSQQDVAEMRSLVEEEEGIPFSVLLIVRTRWCTARRPNGCVGHYNHMARTQQNGAARYQRPTGSQADRLHQNR
jgi:integrative and conjugative element protein (TIGR02256 family)